MVQYQAQLEQTFSALADPTRRGILERLGQGSATVSELAEPFGMSLTGLKKHIRILEDAGLVTTEKVGRTRSAASVRGGWMTYSNGSWRTRGCSTPGWIASGSSSNAAKESRN